MNETEKVAPIRKSVVVQAPVDRVFRVFTERFGEWWPLSDYSMAVDEELEGVSATGAVIEGRVGGRVYEIRSDGTESDWGKVVDWEPGVRLVLAWKPNRRPEPFTEVEVRFTAEGDGTRVDLEHRGWEQLGDRAADARVQYDMGWPGVLDRFASLAAAA
jgi:uncharacterized protein YndB with AHSA1/START domain